MPTYVYECSACNTTFEAEQRITENALDTCPCGSKGTVKRIIQPVGISFKGSGFHINDYKGSSAPSSSEGTKDESSAPAADSTSESTPAPPASTETTPSSTETKSA